MSAKQERDGRKFGEQGRAAVRVLQEHGVTDYRFTKGKHAAVAFNIGDEDHSYSFACTPRSAGGSAQRVQRELAKVISTARSGAAEAPEKRAAPETRNHPERHPQMLHESMVLPATNGKQPKSSTTNLFSETNGQRARRVRAWFEDRLAHARSKGVFSETVDLDPVLAELFLTYNANNRTHRPTNLLRIEEDIRGGRWELNGESIKVAINGQLNDGQHRCQGVVNTGTTIKTVVTFGVPRESRLTVDQGANRTAGDYLAMEGVTNPNNAAAIATLIWQIQNHGGVFSGGPDKHPTKAQVQETFYAHPNIRESLRAVPYKGARLVGGLSNLAFCHYMFSLKNKAAADSFITQLVNGDELKKSDPIWECRRRLMQDSRLKKPDKIEIIWRAWNAKRAGRAPKSMSVLGRLPSLES